MARTARRNPAPLKSALFLRNPSRHNGKRRGSTRGRRNGLAIRANKGAVQKLLARLRKNGLAIRANGRKSNGRGRKWTMPRGVRRLKNGRFASRKNSRYGRRRKNGLAIRANGRKSRRYRRNGSDYISKGTGMLTSLVRKVPVIGKPLAPYVGPGVTAGLALVPIHFALKYAGGYLPDMVKPFAYTLGGVGVATLGTMFPGQTKQFKAVMGLTAVSAGVVIDLYRYLSVKMPSGLSGFFGDGGAYDVVPMDDDAAISEMYADASPYDAWYSGADFSPAEIKAGTRGSTIWRQQFRAARRLTAIKRGGPSRHAGRDGHRWGWLAQLIGWRGVRQLMGLPPQKRQVIIAEFRRQALATLRSQAGGPPAPEYRQIEDQADSDLSGLALRLNGMVHAGGAY